MPLNTAVVYGSARRARQGIKAARFIVRQLEARGHAVILVDSEEQQLPLLDLMYKEYDDGNAEDAAYQQRVVKFLDEYEWYANAMKAARRKAACESEIPVQQALCRG